MRDDDVRPAPARVRLAREWDALFPAAILVVDRPAIVDRFVASGVLVQARIAVVALDGYPRHVTRWLRRGLRAGHHAPAGFLHDAAAVVYPFAFEPLATWATTARRRGSRYRDLGLAHHGADPARTLEEIPPRDLVAYAARALGALLPRDEMLAPLDPGGALHGGRSPCSTHGKARSPSAA